MEEKIYQYLNGYDPITESDAYVSPDPVITYFSNHFTPASVKAIKQIEEGEGIPFMSLVVTFLDLEHVYQLKSIAAKRGLLVAFQKLLDCDLNSDHPIEFYVRKYGVGERLFSFIEAVYNRRFSLLWEIEEDGLEISSIMDYILQEGKLNELLSWYERFGVTKEEAGFDRLKEILPHHSLKGKFK